MVSVSTRLLHSRFRPSGHGLLRAALCVGLFTAIGSAAIAQTGSAVHWPRTNAEISPPVIDSLPPEMTAQLNYTVAAWNQSTVVETSVQRREAPGNSCNPVRGAIRFCVLTDNNWIFAGNQLIYSGDGHLLAVRALVHDYFIVVPPNDTVVGRRALFCYLLGVSYGAVPQDIDPTNADFADASGQQSCMDATNTPEGNENPTPVDLAGLAELYAHSHTDFGVRDFSDQGQGPALPQASDLAAGLGEVTRLDRSGRPSEFARHFPGGVKVVTKVLVQR
jgi:hypothetical protein